MEFSFEPSTRDKFPLLIDWLAEPHVGKWWPDPAANMEAVEKEYGEGIDGTKTNEAYIVLLPDIPIGMIQAYKVDDYPEHAQSVSIDNAVGIDLFIGEPDLIGNRYGPAMILQFVNSIISKKYPAVCINC